MGRTTCSSTCRVRSATGVALGPSGSRAFLGQTDAGVTGLAVVPPSTIAGMSVVNTPNVISYIGDVAGGAVIVGTVPMDRRTHPQSTGARVDLLRAAGRRSFNGRSSTSSKASAATDR